MREGCGADWCAVGEMVKVVVKTLVLKVLPDIFCSEKVNCLRNEPIYLNSRQFSKLSITQKRVTTN